MKTVSHNKTLRQGLPTRKECKISRAWHKS